MVAPRTHLASILESLGPFGVRIFFVISGFVICRLLMLEVSAAISLILIYTLECNCRLQAILRWGPVQAVGLMSYGIYLWQQLFTAPPRFHFATGQIIPSMLPLLFAIILISYSFVERPLMRYGRMLADEARKTLRVCRISTEAEASACSEIG